MDKAHSGAHLPLELFDVALVMALCLQALRSELSFVVPGCCRSCWSSLILRRSSVVKRQLRLDSWLVELVCTVVELGFLSVNLFVGNALLIQPRLYDASVQLLADLLERL